jgi:hypothetical protein
MGESDDPEDVRAILGRYYAIAREVIATHGGTVEKSSAIRSWRSSAFPRPRRRRGTALVAALALREAVAADPQTAALTLRLGVNTGEVVATRESGAGDFLVTGDAVNIAARLQQHAEPGRYSSASGHGVRCRDSGSARPEPRGEGQARGDRRGDPARETRRAARAAGALPRPRQRPRPARPLARRALQRTPRATGHHHRACRHRKSRLVEEFVARMGNGAKGRFRAMPSVRLRGDVPAAARPRPGAPGAERDEDTLALLQRMFAERGIRPPTPNGSPASSVATLGDGSESERRDRDESSSLGAC